MCNSTMCNTGCGTFIDHSVEFNYNPVTITMNETYKSAVNYGVCAWGANVGGEFYFPQIDIPELHFLAYWLVNGEILDGDGFIVEGDSTIEPVFKPCEVNGRSEVKESTLNESN